MAIKKYIKVISYISFGVRLIIVSVLVAEIFFKNPSKISQVLFKIKDH